MDKTSSSTTVMHILLSWVCGEILYTLGSLKPKVLRGKNGERRYKEAHTGVWWNDMQVKVFQTLITSLWFASCGDLVTVLVLQDLSMCSKL